MRLRSRSLRLAIWLWLACLTICAAEVATDHSQPDPSTDHAPLSRRSASPPDQDQPLQDVNGNENDLPPIERVDPFKSPSSEFSDAAWSCAIEKYKSELSRMTYDDFEGWIEARDAAMPSYEEEPLLFWQRDTELRNALLYLAGNPRHRRALGMAVPRENYPKEPLRLSENGGVLYGEGESEIEILVAQNPRLWDFALRVYKSHYVIKSYGYLERFFTNCAEHHSGRSRWAQRRRAGCLEVLENLQFMYFRFRPTHNFLRVFDPDDPEGRGKAVPGRDDEDENADLDTIFPHGFFDEDNDPNDENPGMNTDPVAPAEIEIPPPTPDAPALR